jgi:flavin-dependent dehydrogenase
MSKLHDYVIIGAGPAGSVFATLCARAGLDVCVIERQVFPRERVGESITVDCAKRLMRLGLPSPLAPSSAGSGWRIGAMKMHYESGATFQAKFPEELQHFLLRRAPFDDALLQEAKRSGAVYYEGNVNDLIVENQRAKGVVLRDGEEIRAKRLVVAASGREVGFLRKVVTYQADIGLQIFGGRAFCKKAYHIAQNEVELYVHQKDVAIVTPLDNGDEWAVFVLLHEPVRLEKQTEKGKSSQERAFRGMLRRFGGLSQKLSGVEFAPGIEFHSQMASYAKEISVKGLALIGNSFGYSDPLLSHGVDYAVEGAERLFSCVRSRQPEAAIARLHKATRRLLWLDVRLHRIAYEVVWRESLYAKILPSGETVSGIRLGEKATQLVWQLAGL